MAERNLAAGNIGFGPVHRCFAHREKGRAGKRTHGGSARGATVSPHPAVHGAGRRPFNVMHRLDRKRRTSRRIVSDAHGRYHEALPCLPATVKEAFP